MLLNKAPTSSIRCPASSWKGDRDALQCTREASIIPQGIMVAPVRNI